MVRPWKPVQEVLNGTRCPAERPAFPALGKSGVTVLAQGLKERGAFVGKTKALAPSVTVQLVRLILAEFL